MRDAVAGDFKRRDADLEGLASMCCALGVEEEFRMNLEVLEWGSDRVHQGVARDR